MRIRLTVLAGSLLVLCTATVAPAAGSPARPNTFNPGFIAAYSLAAPTSEAASGLIARVVIPRGAACPNIVTRSTSGKTDEVVMYGRNLPDSTSPAFTAITVCSARLPKNLTDARVLGHAIPAHMPTRVDRLAMFSDSGCWISPTLVQDCSDIDAWPLASIAESIVEQDPDAIVINGDFFYREFACPPDAQLKCGSSPGPIAGLPFRDSAYAWIADVLLPMAPLLSQAPIIVTRGNHEECSTAGNGYFLLFDPRRDSTATCAPVPGSGGLSAPATTPTGTYAIDLSVRPGRTLRLAIVDSAGGSDTYAAADTTMQVPAYEAAARLTAPRSGRESWLVTHRPVYAFQADSLAQPGPPVNPWISANQTAASFGLLGHYDLIFSSHIHLAEAVQIPGQPGQLVLGNGGTLLAPTTGYPLPTTGPTGAAVQSYPPPSSAWVAPRFGFAIATPNKKAGSWRIDMLDPLGQQFARCGVAERAIYCADRHID